MAEIPPNVPVVELSDDEVPEIDWNSGFMTSREFFDMTLSISHAVYPQADLPRHATNFLPQAPIDVVLRIGEETWPMTYSGDPKRPKLGNGWAKFVTDNGLGEGDTCVFEKKLENSSSVTFKVHILKPKLPAALQERLNSAMQEVCIDIDDDVSEEETDVDAANADAKD